MRRGLNKPEVVQAALDVLDQAGLEGLTVRAVAARLDVKAPALYWHFRDKQDLLDEMATELWRRIMGELASLPPDASWREGMEVFAAVLRRSLLSHRDGAKMFSGTYFTDVAVLTEQERGLERLVEAGFSLRGAMQAWALIYNFTIGFCIEEQAVRQSPDDRYSLDYRTERVDPDSNPLVAAAGAELFRDQEDRFGELVAVILEAAERIRTAGVAQVDASPEPIQSASPLVPRGAKK
jgi:TetR/AcrR family tetracycline transcriptional repressor